MIAVATENGCSPATLCLSLCLKLVLLSDNNTMERKSLKTWCQSSCIKMSYMVCEAKEKWTDTGLNLADARQIANRTQLLCISCFQWLYNSFQQLHVLKFRVWVMRLKKDWEGKIQASYLRFSPNETYWAINAGLLFSVDPSVLCESSLTE